MRILMTADTIGGVWTYAVELARALRPQGVEIYLATMGALPSAEQHEQVRRAGNIDLHSSTWKLEWMDDPWSDVERAGEWLLRLEDRLRPDLVHLNGHAHGALEWHAPAIVVGHSCVMSWWEAVKQERAPRSWDHYSHEVARGLHAARLVLTPTRAMLAALERHYGHLRAARVIPNGRDSRLFSPGQKQPFVFAAGRLWDEAKNVAALGAVASRLAWPVYVAGDEEHPDGGSSRFEGLNCLGLLAPEALPYWYSRASIYALPARYEPFGLSAVEAGLSGCALVLGDIASLREVWGDAALFVPPDDSETLERTINRLVEDDGLRADMSSRARARALEYTPRRMAEGYVRAYRDVIASATHHAASQPSTLNPQPKEA